MQHVHSAENDSQCRQRSDFHSQERRSKRAQDRQKFADEAVEPRQPDAGEGEENPEEIASIGMLAWPGLESWLISRVWYRS